jgi:hypothetical protein
MKTKSQEIRAYQIVKAAGKFAGQPVKTKKLDAITLGEIVKRDDHYAYRIVEVEARDGKVLSAHTVAGGDNGTLDECLTALTNYRQSKSVQRSAWKEPKAKVTTKKKFNATFAIHFDILAVDETRAREIAKQIEEGARLTFAKADHKAETPMGKGWVPNFGIVVQYPYEATLQDTELSDVYEVE